MPVEKPFQCFGLFFGSREFFSGILIIHVLHNCIVQIRINWEHKRAKHAIERMWLRGISVRDVEEAVKKGKKVFQRETRLMHALYKRFSVVYDETIYQKTNIRKIFPVTVKKL